MTNTNSLELITNVITMNSNEIATLTGKEHKNVLRDIDKMFLDLYPDETERNLQRLKFETLFEKPTGQGGTQKVRGFNLDKRHTICLIAGYSSIARMRIIDRWQELESQQAPKTLSETLFLAAKLAKEKELLTELTQHQAVVIEEQTDFIDNHVHFPKYIRAEDYEDGNYMSRLDIKKIYFPELGTIDRLTLVLSFYGCEKALYKNFRNMETEVFKVTEIQDIRSRFEDDLEFISISKSRQSNICRHPALPNMELRIKI